MHLILIKESLTVLTLSDLKPGEVGVICGFHPGDKVYRRKLLAMGLTPNTQFEVIRRAPLGDPVQIRVRDFYLSLRQKEFALLKIERGKE
ncbi:FeoA family protein [Coxiella burnetii]|uniref:FeoA family protein n=1 Tax=Coxiella burnetii TaxID=777 RepID=UPI000592DBA9|nr:FeoA family protein [Coxiella burnetii]ATN75063.1 iron transporter FeoA [Coxiella burnetii]ATN76965.1 iron transporter FeoA [Coxiella burnetii]ATN78882.1 iron transporter FeoA [Coxiella burnetii]ATN80794.1 iron transporter FeoA [Coxiella burnetii]OYK89637.1 ferrous iron transport protein A [Coxiella burnetii]